MKLFRKDVIPNEISNQKIDPFYFDDITMIMNEPIELINRIDDLEIFQLLSIELDDKVIIYRRIM